MSPAHEPLAFTEARAAAFAVHAHGDQTYGVHPYSHHLEAVRRVLADSSVDGDLAVAAWLHDVLEDTRTGADQIKDTFGERVLALVEAVTGRGRNRAERRADAYAKIVAYPEAVRLKMADRIANFEACVASGNADLLAMYRKEQPGFEAMVEASGMMRVAVVGRMMGRLRAAMAVTQ